MADLAGNARSGWGGKEEHGLSDVFALGPTLQIDRPNFSTDAAWPTRMQDRKHHCQS